MFITSFHTILVWTTWKSCGMSVLSCPVLKTEIWGKNALSAMTAFLLCFKTVHARHLFQQGASCPSSFMWSLSCVRKGELFVLVFKGVLQSPLLDLLRWIILLLGLLLLNGSFPNASWEKRQPLTARRLHRCSDKSRNDSLKASERAFHQQQRTTRNKNKFFWHFASYTSFSVKFSFFSIINIDNSTFKGFFLACSSCLVSCFLLL